MSDDDLYDFDFDDAPPAVSQEQQQQQQQQQQVPPLPAAGTGKPSWFDDDEENDAPASTQQQHSQPLPSSGTMQARKDDSSDGDYEYDEFEDNSTAASARTGTTHQTTATNVTSHHPSHVEKGEGDDDEDDETNKDQDVRQTSSFKASTKTSESGKYAAENRVQSFNTEKSTHSGAPSGSRGPYDDASSDEDDAAPAERGNSMKASTKTSESGKYAAENRVQSFTTEKSTHSGAPSGSRGPYDDASSDEDDAAPAERGNIMKASTKTSESGKYAAENRVQSFATEKSTHSGAPSGSRGPYDDASSDEDDAAPAERGNSMKASMKTSESGKYAAENRVQSFTTEKSTHSGAPSGSRGPYDDASSDEDDAAPAERGNSMKASTKTSESGKYAAENRVQSFATEKSTHSSSAPQESAAPDATGGVAGYSSGEYSHRRPTYSSNSSRASSSRDHPTQSAPAPTEPTAAKSTEESFHQQPVAETKSKSFESSPRYSSDDDDGVVDNAAAQYEKDHDDAPPPARSTQSGSQSVNDSSRQSPVVETRVNELPHFRTISNSSMGGQDRARLTPGGDEPPNWLSDSASKRDSKMTSPEPQSGENSSSNPVAATGSRRASDALPPPAPKPQETKTQPPPPEPASPVYSTDSGDSYRRPPSSSASEAPTPQRSPTPPSRTPTPPAEPMPKKESVRQMKQRNSAPNTPVEKKRQQQQHAEQQPVRESQSSDGYRRSHDAASIKVNADDEIGVLRVKNRELSKAVDHVRVQLSRIVPLATKAVRRKSTVDTQRLRRLSNECTMLTNENCSLQKKLAKIAAMESVEQNYKMKLEEVRALTDRNKFLTNELRTNAKRLKGYDNLNEQRVQAVQEMKQEMRVLMKAFDRCEKEYHQSELSRETVHRRMSQMEARDKFPEMSAEDVKRINELKTQMVEKDEIIESLQYRLSVLKKAHDTTLRMCPEHSDKNEAENIRGEITELRKKIERREREAPREEKKRAPRSNSKKPVAKTTNNQDAAKSSGQGDEGSHQAEEAEREKERERQAAADAKAKAGEEKRRKKEAEDATERRRREQEAADTADADRQRQEQEEAESRRAAAAAETRRKIDRLLVELETEESAKRFRIANEEEPTRGKIVEDSGNERTRLRVQSEEQANKRMSAKKPKRTPWLDDASAGNAATSSTTPTDEGNRGPGNNGRRRSSGAGSAAAADPSSPVWLKQQKKETTPEPAVEEKPAAPPAPAQKDDTPAWLLDD